MILDTSAGPCGPAQPSDRQAGRSPLFAPSIAGNRSRQCPGRGAAEARSRRCAVHRDERPWAMARRSPAVTEAGGSTASTPHVPVMATEVVEVIQAGPPGPVLDATVGAGGHAQAILEAAPHLSVIGIDRDADALAEAGTALARFGDRVVLRRARFDALITVVHDLGGGPLSGVVFDLGVSSMQLDRAERGFSYHGHGPLDMRMDRAQDLTAAHVVNTYDVERLAGVFSRYGDERFARRVATAVVAARPLDSTTILATVVRDAIPAATRRQGPHPARRVFQALRVEVNSELAVLPGAIDSAVSLLAPGGRIAVLSYHSGEDRIVKSRLAAAASGGCTCPPRLPCVCGAQPLVRLLRRTARRPAAEEIASNPRARSARLRAAERLNVVVD